MLGPAEKLTYVYSGVKTSSMDKLVAYLAERGEFKTKNFKPVDHHGA